MSVREVIHGRSRENYRQLCEGLKKLGIDLPSNSQIEIIKGSKLRIPLYNGVLTVSDPDLVRLAKLASSDAPMEEYLSEREMLGRLYGLNVVYKGLYIPFSKFVKKMRGIDSKKLAAQIEELENKNPVNINYRECLKSKICSELIKRERQTVPPFSDFMEELDHRPTDNLIDILSQISDDNFRVELGGEFLVFSTKEGHLI